MKNSKNQVYTSQALAFDEMPYGKRYGRKGVEYNENGDVIVRFYAPYASTVEFSGMPGFLESQGRRPLVRQDDGHWEAVIPGLQKKYHAVMFYVDGIEAMNPYMNIGAGYDRMMNYIDIPDREANFYEIRKVPHGNIRYEFYNSSVSGRVRDCLVYTPPGYDGSQKTYPVMYIQHGGGENETNWFWQAKLNFILDNLIAQGRAEEMIVVCNSGEIYRDGKKPTPMDFEELLLQDVMPFTEKNFRIKTGGRYTAVAGLSRGAYQALYIGLRQPGKFRYIGMFSGRTTEESMNAIGGTAEHLPLLFEADRMNKKIDLLFCSVGEEEKERYRDLRNAFSKATQNGVRCMKMYTCPGVHEWQTWRHAVFHFLQEVFRTADSGTV